MLKSCLLKAQKPRVRTKELKGNVYFTLTGKNWLRKDSSGCCSIFSKSESFWLVSLSYLRIEKDVLSKERAIVFMAIYGFSFESNLNKCCTELYSAVCSSLATWSSFLCFFVPTKTTWRLIGRSYIYLFSVKSCLKKRFNEQLRLELLCYALEFGSLNPWFKSAPTSYK